MTTDQRDFKRTLAVWLRAVRPFAYTASAAPLLVGAAVALRADAPAMWILLPFVLLGGVLFHTGTNLANDYFDHKSGVDKKHTFGSSGVINDGLLQPAHILSGAVVSFVLGVAFGLVVVAVRGWPIVALGAAGLAGGYFYTGKPFQYKYHRLGDAGVFLMMGPLMALGSYLSLTGRFDWELVWISTPVGFLVAAILHANNLRDIRYDTEAGVRTLANLIGHRASQAVYIGMVAAAYAAVFAMIGAGVLSAWALLTLASLPLAVKNVKLILTSRPEEPERIAHTDALTAQLHLAFSLLLFVSIVAEALVA